MNEEIREIFNELEDDAGKLLSLVHMIKTDLIIKNDERAKTRLKSSSFLADKINSNIIRLLSLIENTKSSR